MGVFLFPSSSGPGGWEGACVADPAQLTESLI